MPKGGLKDNLEGHKLDLSLSSLTDVPVSEIAAIPKATQLDLSDNHIWRLPGDFCTMLCSITWLDLSQNQLVELPADFGLLIRLQHLDLYNNKLITLPLSFCDLRSLKWLDVKDNPLRAEMAAVTGDCLNDAECRKCATAVVSLMQNVRQEEEMRQEIEEKKKQKREAKMQAEKERERLKKKEEKKLEKERKKLEYEAKQAEIQREKEAQKQEEEQNGKVVDAVIEKSPKVVEGKGGLGCRGMMFLSFMGLVLLMVGLHIHCDVHREDEACARGRVILTNYQDILFDYYHHAKDFVTKYISSK